MPIYRYTESLKRFELHYNISKELLRFGIDVFTKKRSAKLGGTVKVVCFTPFVRYNTEDHENEVQGRIQSSFVR